jgi:hypothetical protein
MKKIKQILPYITPFCALGAIVLSIVSLGRSCQTERKQEEVKLVVRLEEREYIPHIDTGGLTEAGREKVWTSPDGRKMKIASVTSIVECVFPEKTPLITITNKSKKPIGVQRIFLKTPGGEKRLWKSGWLDASSNKPIVFPFYLKPDTSLQLTCASTIDTTVLNFNTLYIELVETGEEKQYALRWE